MTSTDSTPRYRNFSTNMPLSANITPRAQSSLITIEKEPERDPEEDCFMCRQAHVYVKPIGMQQERRVARRYPPPLTRAQIDELSQKKHLSKQEVRKLLQCYFPEIKNVKYFQLHKYHSCCYDPKHVNLCKNHITALQHEREQHPEHLHVHENDSNLLTNYDKQNGQKNRVSFVRIKIEPTKGIPTRFLGPTALPESLADMLIKQVNHLENKKNQTILTSNNASLPYNVRRIHNPYVSDDEDDDDEEENDSDIDEEDDDDDEEEEIDNQPTNVQGQIMANSTRNDKQQEARLQRKPVNNDLVVEDLDELNRLYVDQQGSTYPNSNNQETSLKPTKSKSRKNITKKKHTHGHKKPKLKHWEILAIEQAKQKQEACNCRHHVMRLVADQVVYDWCRCKDHQHKEIIERHKTEVLSPTPEEPKQRTPTPPPPPRVVPPPPPPPPPPPRPKPRKIRKKSIGIDATQTNTTELALAYDPSAVDYDMIQEVIYYRTSSGRLIKPEITNAFTYDTMPPAINTTVIDPLGPAPKKAEVLYMAPNGELQPYEVAATGQTREKGKSGITLKSGTLYNGQVYVDPAHSTINNGTTATMPVLKLPVSVTSSKRSTNDNTSQHQPVEFTIAKFSPDQTVDTPSSRRSQISSSQVSGSQVSGSHGKSKSVSKSASKPIQKTSKPTFANLEPTPDYGRQSSILANRRWFDQPLGDQNLRPVHDGQYGLIAGSSTNQHHFKTELARSEPEVMNLPPNKNPGNCTIS